MATNPNDYCEQARESEDVCALMRRINALEAGNINSGPLGIAGHSDIIYVGDTYNFVQTFDTDGVFAEYWLASIDFPADIKVYNNEIYVIRNTPPFIRIYNTSGVLQRQFGDSGWEDWEFNVPMAITVYDGEVYAIDGTEIKVFSTGGVYSRKWGFQGPGNGGFDRPRGIAANATENRIYVVDEQYKRVQAFETDGTFDFKWGTLGSGNGQFSNPTKIIEYNDELYVCDRGNHRIQVFAASTGAYVRQWGSSGTGNGQFAYLVGPGNIAEYNSEIYVVDFGNVRIQAFSAAGTYQRQWSTVHDLLPQTEFQSYTTAAKASLGTPDGGVSVPANDAIAGSVADDVSDHITDMRTAIEALALVYINAVTGNRFNWTGSSADNLYYVAMGDRTKYGATGGAQYDWTRNAAAMEADMPRDIDIGEIEECVTKLEASAVI